MNSNGQEVDDKERVSNGSQMSSNTGTADNKKTAEVKPKVDGCGRKVESRYKQSAQQWAQKRAEVIVGQQQQQPTVGPTGSRRRSKSRGRVPNPRVAITTSMKKASTPIHSNGKPLNITGVSVITEGNDLKRDVKPKIMRRKSMAAKYFAFGSDSGLNEGMMGSTTSAGTESESKIKEMENSVLVSIYLQTMLFNLKAKQMQSERNENTGNTIADIWSQTNQIRDYIIETQKSLLSLKNTIDFIDILDKQKTLLEQYLNIRSEMNSLFNSLSELIARQKLVIKAKNFNELDFNKLNELMDGLPTTRPLNSIGNISNALVNIESAVSIGSEINLLEIEFNECYQTFANYSKLLEKYDTIESKASLTLSNLF